MGKKNQARKGRSGAPQGGGAVDSLSADLSDLFKTLPPIKRADLTKTVEKLFQVIRESETTFITKWPRHKSTGFFQLLQRASHPRQAMGRVPGDSNSC